MTRTRRKTVSALAILTSPLAFLLTYLICRNHLPARIPDPWDWTGGFLSNDGSRTDHYFLLFRQLPAVIFLGVALAMLALTDGRNRGAIIGVAIGGTMGLFLTIKTMLISYNAPNIEAVHPQFWQFLLAYVALGAYARLVAVALPIPESSADVAAASDINLEPGRRVMWFGQATSTLKLWGGVALVGASVGVAVVNPSASIAVLIVAGLLLYRSTVKVRIDDHGITVINGPVHWPRFTVPLNQITSIRPHHLESLHFRLRAQGIDKEGIDPRSRLIKTGNVLIVDTREHLPIYVSVEHAEEAADVTNALIARSQRERPMLPQTHTG